MPTTPPRVTRWAPRAHAVAVGLLVGILLAGCGTSTPSPVAAPVASGTPPSPQADVGGGATLTPPSEPDVLAGIDRSLRLRATAVSGHDRAGFDAGIAGGPVDAAFAAQQATYYDNLVQLPLRRLSYAAEPASLVRDPAGARRVGYWVVVDVRMQLGGFDARPVHARDRYHLVQAPHAPGGFRLTSVSDTAWEVAHHVTPQPWDLGPVVVRQRTGVLGVFDAGSVVDAPAVMAAVARGIHQVARLVPYSWPHSVVVYALSDTRFLASIRNLPGGDPADLDGVAFPVLGGGSGHRVAATRVVLNPRMLTVPAPERDRLVRHELTHVAVGAHDDLAPLWLTEGLAEYVSVQPMPRQQRYIARAAVTAAKAGFHDLPTDATFDDADVVVHYGEGWWACEYLARTVGRPVLWSILDQLDRPGADQDAVLESLAGLNSRTLARKAGKLLLGTFDPAALGHGRGHGHSQDRGQDQGQITTGRAGTSRRR